MGPVWLSAVDFSYSSEFFPPFSYNIYDNFHNKKCFLPWRVVLAGESFLCSQNHILLPEAIEQQKTLNTITKK